MENNHQLLSVIDSFGHDALITSKFFIYKYGVLCNTYSVNQDSDIKGLLDLLNERYQLSDQNIIHRNLEQKKDIDGEIDFNASIFIVEIAPQLWLKLDKPRIVIFFSDKYTQEDLKPLIAIIKESRQKQVVKNEFFMVSYSTMMNEYSLESFKINKTELDIEVNYNDDFLPVHDTIVSFLKTDLQSGIILLHGKVGTGKTNYIRWLISEIDKKIIFIPPHMISFISSPEFIPFISFHKDSIIIIEDCEELLKSRDDTSGASSGLSNLLNIGDGLLADAFNFKIVCTFNTSLHNIDQAILRKGRLIAKYEFGNLSLQKTEELFRKLDYQKAPETSMTLAEIYNYSSDNFVDIDQEKAIGF